jgi:hypothetical protein
MQEVEITDKTTKAKTPSHMKTFLKYTFLAATIAAFAVMANATPTLKIWTQQTGFLTITDNGVGDVNATVGGIVWTGSIGSWSFNLVGAVTYPEIGSLAIPEMDLNFLATSSTGGTLKILFSNDGFGPTVNQTSEANIGGTTQGSVSYKAFGGVNNNLFDLSNLLCAGPNTGSFSADVIGAAVNNQGPYSLTSVITITQVGAGTSSGDVMLTVPDSGTTLLLLGAGLTGLGLISRLRRRNS